MRANAIEWNGKTILDKHPHNSVMACITLRVTRTMINGVISKSENNSWRITKVGDQVLSNKLRDVAEMTLTTDLWRMHNIMDNLGLSWIKGDGKYDYYRSELDNSRGNKLTCAVVYSAGKSWKLRRLNYPMNVDSKYYRVDGKLYHIVNLKGCYSN